MKKLVCISSAQWLWSLFISYYSVRYRTSDTSGSCPASHAWFNYCNWNSLIIETSDVLLKIQILIMISLQGNFISPAPLKVEPSRTMCANWQSKVYPYMMYVGKMPDFTYNTFIFTALIIYQQNIHAKLKESVFLKNICPSPLVFPLKLNTFHMWCGWVMLTVTVKTLCVNYFLSFECFSCCKLHLLSEVLSLSSAKNWHFSRTNLKQLYKSNSIYFIKWMYVHPPHIIAWPLLVSSLICLY